MAGGAGRADKLSCASTLLPAPDSTCHPPPPPTPQGYNPGTRKASILYTTGEAEELALDDIVRDGHMSLIQLAPAR